MSRSNVNRKKILTALLIAAVGGLYILFGCFVAGCFPIDPDKATHLHQGIDAVKGNFFFNNWILSGVNFITTDIPFYSIGGLFGGLDRSGIIIATGLMIAGWAMICFIAANAYPNGNRIVTLVLSCVLLSVPCLEYANFLRVHTGALILCVAADLLASRICLIEDAKRRRKVSVLLAILLALGTLGDILTVILGIIPICAFALGKAGGCRHDETKRKKYTGLLITAIAALIFGIIIDRLYYLIGSADKGGLLDLRVFWPSSEWKNRLDTLVSFMLKFTGSDFTGLSLGSFDSFIRLLNAVLLLLGLIAMIKTLYCFVRGKKHDDLSVLLSLGVLAITLVFIFTELSAERYVCFVPYALYVILIRNYRSLFSSTVFSRKLIIGGICVLSLVCFVSRLVGLSEYKRAVSEYDELVEVLEEHELYSGFTSFENAAPLRVVSNGGLKMAPVSCYEEGKMSTLRYFTDYDWFEEQEMPNFVIASEQEMYTIDRANVIKCYGEPSESFECGRFEIMVYDDPLPVQNHTDNEYCLFDMSANDAVTISGSDMIARTQGIVYGPYCSVSAGTHTATVKGENLSDVPCDVFSASFSGISYETVSQNDYEIVIRFTTDVDIDDLEIRMINSTEENAVFRSLTIE